MRGCRTIAAAGIAISALMAQAVSAECPIPPMSAVKSKGVFEAAILKAKALGKPKGEFETTAAYDDRMAKAATSIAPAGSLTFSWIVDLSTFSYDADSETVTFGSRALDTSCPVNLTASTYSLTHPFCFQQTLRSSRSKPQIMGNAYGAKAAVTVIHDDNVGVVMAPDRPRDGPLGYMADNLFRFHATVPEAQSLKRNAVMVLTIRPKAPVYLEGTFYDGATLDSPIENYGNSYLLVGDLQCAALADAVSGKVFQTLDLGAVPAQ